jgi:hypothetical protein
MNPIKITPTNTAVIESALKSVNDKSEAHCYTSAEVIAILAGNAEAALNALGLPKSKRNGAQWTETSGASVSRSYAKIASKRNATRVVLERKAGHWYLTHAVPAVIYAEGGGKGALRLSDAAKAHLAVQPL